MRLLTIAAASLVLAVPATATGAPALKVRTLPFTVTGSGFKAHEFVRIVVDASAHYTATVRALANGTFSVRVRGVHVPRCTGFIVRATGARGSRAAMKYRPPECSPQ